MPDNKLEKRLAGQQHLLDRAIAALLLVVGGDTLLAIVHEAGPACHNGTESCFDTLEIL